MDNKSKLHSGTEQAFVKTTTYGVRLDIRMSSLYPEMRFSWEIRSVDALFCNGMTRVGDLSREAILSSIRDEQVSFYQKQKRYI